MINPVNKLGEQCVTRILQAKELEMLKKVKSIFFENDIPFFLACGTALGCARHEGFIPWDDDIDVYINGKDYIKAKTAINVSNTGLKFKDYSTENDYPYWFPKIVATDTVLVEQAFGTQSYNCGVYIDVFPLFYANDNGVIRALQEEKRYIRYACVRAYYNEAYAVGYRKIFKSIASYLNPQKIQKKLENTYKANNKESRYLVDPGVFHRNALLSSDSFTSIVQMKFEDTVMPMPIGFESYLTSYYGEYMELPPVSERISRHHIAELSIPGVSELIEE